MTDSIKTPTASSEKQNRTGKRANGGMGTFVTQALLDTKATVLSIAFQHLLGVSA
jgi:hypothetical protein